MQTVQTHLSLKEKHRQERENLILQAANEAFHEKGYHETSIDEIAARVGIAKGTVYLHFPGKEDLLIAIFLRDAHTFLEGMNAAIESHPTPDTQIEAICKLMRTGLHHKHAHLVSSVYNDTDLKNLFAKKGGQLTELWQAIVSRITLILEEGKKTGVFDASIPTKIMVVAFFNIFSPKGVAHLMASEEMSSEEIEAYLTRIYLNGITAK
jgi:TetR/AcrR family transcriptional regulator, fatty acid metabolism regulator protein